MYEYNFKNMIGIIGGTGTIGQIIMKGISKDKELSKLGITFSARDIDKINKIEKEYNIKSSSNEDLIKKSDIIFISIKPQNFKEFKSFKADNKIIISVMAGIKLSSLENKFPGAKIVRSMPNLGGFVSKSTTGWCSTEINNEEEILIKKCLSSFGTEIKLDNDDDIDKFAALIGSGPAYLYFFMQTLAEQGIKFGFKKEDVRSMIFQLIDGSFEYIQKEDACPLDLIDKVSSKGGSTEEAMKYLKEKEIKQEIKEAINKAYLKNKKLSE